MVQDQLVLPCCIKYEIKQKYVIRIKTFNLLSHFLFFLVLGLFRLWVYSLHSFTYCGISAKILKKTTMN